MLFPMETLEQMQGFFWVFLRVSILFFLLPLFGATGIPSLWKIGLSAVISLVLTPVIPAPQVLPQSVPDVMAGVVSEAILGLSLAFGARVLIASVQLAGQFMGFQMGFSMARAIDPQDGAQSTSLSQFLYIFMVLLFLIMDGHHLFIAALAKSFYLVPPCMFVPRPALAQLLIQTGGQMFLVALKISAPILIALFLVNLCLGIVARTVPQVNILMIGFPLNIGVGLILFGLTLTSLPPYFEDLTRGMGQLLLQTLRVMKP
jgi:flagellar biosynthesis protein FliR